MEENAKKKRKKREPIAYLIENGVRTRFVAPPIDEKDRRPSPLALWLEAHPNFGEILDMRAVLK
jgi:hypothetical protein